mmetsp:Transcript_1694/g.6769  ORF Transcript_1694/g.6769 Transcript_1694/m.6769 type:complete len:215 (+) Transcript_1694:12347-12991(+)
MGESWVADDGRGVIPPGQNSTSVGATVASGRNSLAGLRSSRSNLSDVTAAPAWPRQHSGEDGNASGRTGAATYRSIVEQEEASISSSAAPGYAQLLFCSCLHLSNCPSLSDSLAPPHAEISSDSRTATAIGSSDPWPRAGEATNTVWFAAPGRSGLSVMASSPARFPIASSGASLGGSEQFQAACSCLPAGAKCEDVATNSEAGEPIESGTVRE